MFALQKKKTEPIEQAQQKPNYTRIPTQMKARMEQSTGMSFDDVQVHYGSDRPAKVGAYAYTQGNQVYIGPGQEQHLPHELGHVVQQKLGIVRADTRLPNGLTLNTDEALERQANEIRDGRMPYTIQRKAADTAGHAPIQRAGHGNIVVLNNNAVAKLTSVWECEAYNNIAPDSPMANAVPHQYACWRSAPEFLRAAVDSLEIGRVTDDTINKLNILCRGIDSNKGVIIMANVINGAVDNVQINGGAPAGENPMLDAEAAPVPGEQEAPVLGEQAAPVPGEQEAPVPREQEAPVPREQEAPVLEAENEPAPEQANNIATFDIKIGARTASKRELIHRGQSNPGMKKSKMKFADFITGSHSRRYRYIPSGDESRLAAGQATDERVIGGIKEKLRALFPNSQQERWNQIISRLRQICDAVNTSNCTYIAASVFITIRNDGVIVRLIDLDHPVSEPGANIAHIYPAADNVEYQKYKDNFIFGLNALIGKLEDARPQQAT